MAYIGKTPSSGIRNRFIYTATAGQTTFSGTDDHSRTLSYTDAEFTDVFLNGVKLDKSDYTATSGTSIVLDEGAAVDDILEVLAFDTFSVFSGEFSQDVTVGGATTLSGDLTVDTNTMFVDSTNNRVGIGTSSPAVRLDIVDGGTYSGVRVSNTTNNSTNKVGHYTGRHYTNAEENVLGLRISSVAGSSDVVVGGGSGLLNAATSIQFYTAANTTTLVGTERMRIDSSGNAKFNSPSWGVSSGVELTQNGVGVFIASSLNPLAVQRLSTDGDLVRFYTGTTQQGTISVSGTTVSYNGGHLARWSQLNDGTKNETIVKGTVMTNLDQMAVWSHDAVEAQDAVYDDDGNVVTEAVEAKDAYTEDNEQLNCMAVSSVEGDPNVAGVFVNWDNDDDEFNDMNIAMTGDMVIRIAQGTTVARGDLLMSAGDGTAKPQGDDIVRSKTIAKVTSTNVSHTYDDGSYLVPCVLMAC